MSLQSITDKHDYLRDLDDDALVLLAVLMGFTFRTSSAFRHLEHTATYPDGGSSAHYATRAECARAVISYWTETGRSPTPPDEV